MPRIEPMFHDVIDDQEVFVFCIRMLKLYEGIKPSRRAECIQQLEIKNGLERCRVRF